MSLICLFYHSILRPWFSSEELRFPLRGFPVGDFYITSCYLILWLSYELVNLFKAYFADCEVIIFKAKSSKAQKLKKLKSSFWAIV
jgi:hypothetical protein